MTNPMLAELDAVVTELLRIKHAQRDGNYFGTQAELIKASNRANQFLLTHHATLADMAKRLEAAQWKLSRLTGMRNEWERDAREHLMTFGQHLPASVECLVERFDAAIDATQEGEG